MLLLRKWATFNIKDKKRKKKKKKKAVNTGATTGYHLVTSGDRKAADKLFAEGYIVKSF